MFSGLKKEDKKCSLKFIGLSRPLTLRWSVEKKIPSRPLFRQSEWKKILSMDTVSKKKRSEIMSKIRGKDTKIEIMVRSQLFRMGYRFRKNVKSLPGCPDIVLPKLNAVVFVHGCFWHGHEGCLRLPKTRQVYWRNKIEGNARRDKRNAAKLRRQGWRVFTLWECKLKKDFDREIAKLESKLAKLS